MRASLVAATALLAWPAAASAGTASIVLVPGPCDIVCSKYQGSGTPLAQFRYAAAPGEANTVTLSVTGQTVTLRDASAPVTPADNCTRADDHAVNCALGQSAPTGYTVTLDDLDDVLALAVPPQAGVVADGGGGADQLTGAAEIDTFDGGPGADRIASGAGDDRIVDVDGDPDTVDGGDDRDALDLSKRTTAANVDLAAGTGADGGALASVEDVSGGAGDDALIGSDRPNALTGGKGNDLIKGAGGNDFLDGGPGRDIFAAGTGDDEIATRDGTGDTVACGDGRDKVRSFAEGSPDAEYGETQLYTAGPDLADVLDLDCELTVFGARRDVDGTLAAAPPVRFTEHVLVLRTPCRCAGRVTARTARSVLGSARFTRRARTVRVRSPRRLQGVVQLRWRSGRRTGAWSVELPA